MELQEGQMICDYSASDFPLTKIADYITNVELDDVLKDEKVVEWTKVLLKDVEERKYVRNFDGRIEVLSHRLLLLISLLDSIVLNKVVDYEAKYFRNNFAKLNRRCRLEVLKLLEVEVEEKEDFYLVPVLEWLKLKIGSELPLADQLVANGYVWLPEHRVMKFAEVVFKSYLKRLTNRLKADNELIERIRRFVELNGEVEGLLRRLRPKPRRRQLSEDEHPPCIRSFLEKLKNGEHLSHQARFTLATYMHFALKARGLKEEEIVEQIVDLFRSSPDFNERIARYQVEHLMGLRGGKKVYSPYGCRSLKSFGLCPVEDSCGVTNPVQFAYGRR